MEKIATVILKHKSRLSSENDSTKLSSSNPTSSYEPSVKQEPVEEDEYDPSKNCQRQSNDQDQEQHDPYVPSVSRLNIKTEEPSPPQEKKKKKCEIERNSPETYIKPEPEVENSASFHYSQEKEKNKESRVKTERVLSPERISHSEATQNGNENIEVHVLQNNFAMSSPQQDVSPEHVQGYDPGYQPPQDGSMEYDPGPVDSGVNYEPSGDEDDDSVSSGDEDASESSCEEDEPEKTEETINIRQLAQMGVLTDITDCIKFLRKHHLLAREMNCPKCVVPMKEEKTITNTDGYRWRCPKIHCKTTVTIRKGSFFEKSRLELTKLIMVTYFWAADVPQHQVASESDVSVGTVIGWANLLRDVCSSDIISKQKKIGGPGHTVSIDETQLTRRKWLFGGIDHTTREVFLELIPERGRTMKIMEGLITKHIANGTMIWSDEFAAYKNIEKLGEDYTHKTVNQSCEFVSGDGVHTNRIKNLWAGIKYKFRKMKGVAHHRIPSHLDEWLWRRQFSTARRFLEILNTIANDPIYDVTG